MAENSSNVINKIQSSSLSDLNDELLVEILCRLGTSKYAIQCKCICKRWCAVIDVNTSRDSYFLRRWRKINKELPIALLTNRSVISHHAFDCEIPTVKFLDFLPCPSSKNNSPSIHIHAVYKDLVFCSQSSCDDDDIYYIRYYICNPFTKQWTVLPPPPLLEYMDCDFEVALFAPGDGNGNDIEKVDVVRVAKHVFQASPLWDIEDMVMVPIISCDDSSGKWKIWNASKVCLEFLEDRVSYNGMLVWLSATINKTRRLIGFKFDTHIVDNINQDIVNYTYLPPGFEEKRCSKTGSYKGCLRIAYMDSTDPFDHHKLFVWELNSHTQDWKLVHAIDFSEAKDFAIAKNSNRFLGGCVLAFHPHDRDILYLAIDRLEKYSAALYSDESYWWSCNVREKTANLIRGKFPPIRQECNVFPLQLPSCRPSSVPLLKTEKRP